MQHPSDSVEIDEPEENGQLAPVADDTAEPSTVLAEVLPGIAVVFGEVPAEFKLEMIDFGLVPASDRGQISTFLATIGNTATVLGNAGKAMAGAQGLYRLGAASQAWLGAGGALAVKDGANLGAVFHNGKIVHQARFIPVSAINPAELLATLGPAISMIAIQMQLSEVTGLARTNIALTNQVLTDIRHEQWAELEGLVGSIDRAITRAREIEAVAPSLWDGIAATEPDLRKQRNLYRMNVSNHVRQIRHDEPGRRAYLETNAEAILFDAHALLSSLKAWTGYQALHAARARGAGAENPDEARLVDVIARDTREALEPALADTTALVDALTRELRIIVELPGRATLPLSSRRKDSAAVRRTATQLLEAIQPLADALHPPAPELEAPGAVCAPESLDLAPYLRILRWYLDDGESLRAVGFADEPDSPDAISSVLSGARGLFAAAMDKPTTRTLVVVTDRRIIIGRTDTFLEQAEIRQEFPVEVVRYVRVTTGQDKNSRSAIDLITRDENIRWQFPSDVDNTRVDTLAAVLAESMTIPDTEREELRRRNHALAVAGAERAITETAD
ncbi:hypothetical protein Ait01nite_027140 [Actinoplanes italicus]|uniref:Uncharacterized protein n=1 Tax=Actinoplanes italicus TaxID=113567 RepID=A0A2T0KEV9_9ACTN|nr:hypothetical protein [Actinoplanes italicus]PRX21914.1 hypothetical protein CLV67_10591 [Actinoplanes italicus]GIE29669.1 hypothetical protein Ait01nite_027140 [Actinoplanes italicus]